MKEEEKWLYEITPQNNLLSIDLKELWRYRDLLVLFVKRDVITLYKQTILGPLWYLIQPLFTSVVFTVIFNNVAGIETPGMPSFLFNLAGVTSWNYFRECLTGTADTFKKNQNIFGKVYFPRIIMPLSVVVSNLTKFGIQLLIFICFYIYYISTGWDITPSKFIFLYPLLIVLMAFLGLGLGMIISSMVTKYRDLSFLVTFGVSLLMYVSLVNLPYSKFEEKGVAWLVDYNPMAHLIEMSRFLLIGKGNFNIESLLFTALISIVVLIFGVLIFNKTEKSFIDTI
ncbi:ABC transporter permease [Wenyingzhuangia sp. IMCC45533]